MTEYGNTIKIQGAVNTEIFTPSPKTLYTCPTNSFAIVNVFMSGIPLSGANLSIFIGGQLVARYVDTNGSGTYDSVRGINTNGTVTCEVYVGPGQSVTATGTGYCGAAGVEFRNTFI